jgi:hypothetical protein
VPMKAPRKGVRRASGSPKKTKAVEATRVVDVDRQSSNPRSLSKLRTPTSHRSSSRIRS